MWSPQQIIHWRCRECTLSMVLGILLGTLFLFYIFTQAFIPRAWDLSWQLRTSNLSIAGLLAMLLSGFVRAGLVEMKPDISRIAEVRAHWLKHLMEGVIPAVIAILLIFVYNLLIAIPWQISKDYRLVKMPTPVPSLHEVPAFAYEKSQQIQVLLTPLDGITLLSPKEGDVITLEDLHQYEIAINNKGDKLVSVSLRLQFPYPVERSEIENFTETASLVSFKPVSLPIVGNGRGQFRILRTPLSANYTLLISGLRPSSSVKILCVLNSWRDPRGKSVPKEEIARYFIPEVGLSITYINGYFAYRTASHRLVERDYYAPMTLTSDKIVSLGHGARPKALVERVGFQ